MYILALETTGKYGSAALIDENGRCYLAASSEEMNHLKDIINLTDEVLDKAGIGKQEITHVAASVGPGSFTGIRIGVTTARAIGQMLDIPCISVSTLESMAETAGGDDADYIATIINARRRQTYAAVWKAQADGSYEAVLAEKQYMIEEVCEFLRGLEGKVLFTGDGIDAYQSIIEAELEGHDYEYAGTDRRYQSAEGAAVIAHRKGLAGDTVTYDSLMPEYMRKSEAEMRLEEGSLSKKIHG